MTQTSNARAQEDDAGETGVPGYRRYFKTKQATKANSVLPATTSHTETVGIEVTAKVPENICFDK